MTTSLEVVAERVENLRESQRANFAELKVQLADVARGLDAATTRGADLKRDFDDHARESDLADERLEEMEVKVADHLRWHERQANLADGKASAYSWLDKLLLRGMAAFTFCVGTAVSLHQLKVI